MKITRVVLHRLHMPMMEPFVTSFGREDDKNVILVEVQTSSGCSGFSECVASLGPYYSSETNDGAWHILRDFLIPRIWGLEIEKVEDLRDLPNVYKDIRGHQMSKAAIEMAIWDAFAAEVESPLTRLLSSEPVKSEISVGISIGIQSTTNELLRKVEGYLTAGFKRLKVKIKPGYDIEPLAAIRQAFGDVPLMADANSAYTLRDVQHLQRLDEYHLMMIEQPLAADDIVDHAHLQQHLHTAICLDESIHSVEDVRKALELKACRIINLKVGRVGGFAETLKIHDLCLAEKIPLWCGGMLETGIGRLHNIAVTALPGFTLPGDTAPSARYFEEDIIHPAVEFSSPGHLGVEDLCGVASRVSMDLIKKWTKERLELSAVFRE